MRRGPFFSRCFRSLANGSAVFGPSRTTLDGPIAKWLKIYIDLKEASGAPCTYIFHKAGDSSSPLSPSRWSRVVQAVWKRHSGVPLTPKVHAPPLPMHMLVFHISAAFRECAHLSQHDTQGLALVVRCMAEVRRALERDAPLCCSRHACALPKILKMPTCLASVPRAQLTRSCCGRIACSQQHAVAGHSSKTQQSHAYNLDGSNKIVESAFKVAAEFASKF